MALDATWKASPSSIKRDSEATQREAEHRRIDLARAAARRFIAEHDDVESAGPWQRLWLLCLLLVGKLRGT